MKLQTKVIRIKGANLTALRRSFAGYVSTGEDDSSNESEYKGNLAKDGTFYVVRKGHEKNTGLNYEARMTGKVFEEDGDTVIEYDMEMSPVFRTCTLIIGALALSITGLAIFRYLKDSVSGLLLPASFFVIAFIIMLAVLLIKPECRALEKCLDKIAGEYADQIEKQ